MHCRTLTTKLTHLRYFATLKGGEKKPNKIPSATSNSPKLSKLLFVSLFVLIILS